MDVENLKLGDVFDLELDHNTTTTFEQYVADCFRERRIRVTEVRVLQDEFSIDLADDSDKVYCLSIDFDSERLFCEATLPKSVSSD